MEVGATFLKRKPWSSKYWTQTRALERSLFRYKNTGIKELMIFQDQGSKLVISQNSTSVS